MVFSGSGYNPQQNQQQSGGFDASKLGLNEVFLGQIVQKVIVNATMNWGKPTTTQTSGGQPQQPQTNSQQQSQLQSRQQTQQPQLQQSSSSPANQIGGSSALTSEGGLSFGGGARLLGGGTPFGISAVGTTTVNNDGYQTAGGISVGGISLNAGAKLGSGGLTFSGGIQRAQVGQGIVGSKVGPLIVGPRIGGS